MAGREPAMEDGVLPNFFILGAQKCGTTSLYHYVGDHPQVFVSPVRPHFFSYGLNGTFGSPTWKPVRDLDTYCRLFSGATNEIAIGDPSSSYLDDPESSSRIHQYAPGAKLIAVLRDPIARAYSQFLMLRRDGKEPFAEFAEAIEAEQRGEREDGEYQGWTHRPYLERSRYLPQLLRYLEHFPREQLQIHLHEDLEADANRVVSEVFRFLGVDERFQVDTRHHHNAARDVRRPRLESLVDSAAHAVAPAARALIPAPIRRRVYWRVAEWSAQPAPSMPPGIRRRYIPLLRDEVLGLQDLLGRDLSAWLSTADS